jgi:hypothetical protein
VRVAIRKGKNHTPVASRADGESPDKTGTQSNKLIPINSLFADSNHFLNKIVNLI